MKPNVSTLDILRARFARLNDSPLWAIRPEAILAALTAQHADGGWEAAKPSVRGPQGNKVAIIPIQGVLTNDGPSWYGSNYQTIASAAEAAASDPEVKRVVLAVDSPGGEVMGLPETAAVLASVAKIKPVSAIVEGQATSAAYYLASQASDITMTPSGEVGSVGIKMVHRDMSKMLDEVGIKVTELHAGDFKTEFTPYAPLTDAAKEDMQKRLDAAHADFISAIDAGRGARATQDIRAKRYGEGRTFSAGDALGHGLVDKVQAPRDFYRSVVPASAAHTEAPTFPMRTHAEVAALLKVAHARVVKP